MKILVFYRSLNQGGVQRMMVTLVNYFAESGVDVTLLLIRKEGEFLKMVDQRVIIDQLEFGSYRSLIPVLKKKLQANQYNFMFTATPSLNVAAIIAARLTNTKIIISERSDPFKEFKGTKFGLYKIAFLLIPFIYRFANKIVAVSIGVAEELRKIALVPADRIKVIYNPAYNENAQIQVDAVVDHPWLINKDVPVIISAGRLTHQKNFQLLIRAISYLQQKQPVRLIILGDGPLKNDLLKLINDLNVSNAIDLVGFNMTPISWISKADVFVLSSLWEGFGNILIDALAAQTTIVSTNCKSGPAEILENGKYGYLLSSFEPEEMASAIKLAIEKPFDKTLLLKRAKMFSRERIMIEYEALFKAIKK